MRGQQPLVFLVAILAAAAVIGGCIRDTTEAQDLPITVTDSGVRVTLASLKESDNRLIMTFSVENERPTSDTVQSAIDQGGIAVESDLQFVTLTFQENASGEDGTAPSSESTAAVEVMLEQPADSSQPVTFAFTQMLVPPSPGNIPIAVAGRWEFQFVPTVA